MNMHKNENFEIVRFIGENVETIDEDFYGFVVETTGASDDQINEIKNKIMRLVSMLNPGFRMYEDYCDHTEEVSPYGHESEVWSTENDSLEFSIIRSWQGAYNTPEDRRYLAIIPVVDHVRLSLILAALGKIGVDICMIRPVDKESDVTCGVDELDELHDQFRGLNYKSLID